MTWNYRVVKKTYMGDTLFGIHEVYYDDDGNPDMVTVQPVGIVGDDIHELRREYVYYLRALLRPALDYDEIGGDDA